MGGPHCCSGDEEGEDETRNPANLHYVPAMRVFTSQASCREIGRSFIRKANIAPRISKTFRFVLSGLNCIVCATSAIFRRTSSV